MIAESNETSQVVLSQLLENTGASMLDSGGAYGRHWERNNAREIVKENSSRLSFNKWGSDPNNWDLDFSVGLYHFMTSLLEFDPLMDKIFHRFGTFQNNIDENWLTCLDSFRDYVSDKWNANGLYGDNNPFIENTYNHENNLDQVIQFLYFEINLGKAIDGNYTIISVHGGCDVRGGYSKPRAYKIPDCEGYVRLSISMTDATIGCANGHYWDTDDCSHWYPECSTEAKNLNDYTADELKINDNNEGFCPLCNEKLTAGVSY